MRIARWRTAAPTRILSIADSDSGTAMADRMAMSDTTKMTSRSV
jgi:hypothetical protein